MIMMIAASTTSEYGWGGPGAILVAIAIMNAIHFTRVWVERRKIENHSPTAGQKGQCDDTMQVRGGVTEIDIPLDWDEEGDVDLDEIEQYGWGSISREGASRGDVMTLDDWIMTELPTLGYRRTVNEGAARYGVSVRTVTRRIAEIRNSGF